MFQLTILIVLKQLSHNLNLNFLSKQTDQIINKFNLGANDWDLLTIFSKKTEPVYCCTYFNKDFSLNVASIIKVALLWLTMLAAFSETS